MNATKSEATSAIADHIATLSDRFEALIANVEEGAWSNQSPCEDWTARDVVRHVIDVHAMVLKPTGRGLSTAPSVDDDPLGAFRAARAEVAAVLADPQLATMEYHGHFGRSVVQETIDSFLGFDLVIHGWDLARATGQDTTLDPAEVERVWAQAEQLGDALRSPGVCGQPVEIPEDSSRQDQLLAYLGRDPR